jgi:hypothetical protein
MCEASVSRIDRLLWVNIVMLTVHKRTRARSGNDDHALGLSDLASTGGRFRSRNRTVSAPGNHRCVIAYRALEMQVGLYSALADDLMGLSHHATPHHRILYRQPQGVARKPSEIEGQTSAPVAWAADGSHSLAHHEDPEQG